MHSKKRRIVAFYMLTLLCFQIHSNAQEDSAYEYIHVGVILDMGSWFGKNIHSCITMAVSDFYTVNGHYKTRIVIHNRDTHGEPLHALSAALDLLEKTKVQAIIGSEATAEAKLLAVLGDEAKVPILSLSPTPSSDKHPYFLQITQDETSQFKVIATMSESFKWKSVIIICADTDSGKDMATLMTKAFQEKNIFITYTSLISTSASSETVHKELHKLSTFQTKKYIIHTCYSLASKILINAKHLGMMDAGYKWIITSKSMNFFDIMDDEVVKSMQGVVGFKSYIPQSNQIQKFTSKWRKDNDLKDINAYIFWAYDAVSALAMAVERTYILKLNTTLLEPMLRISIDGLSGAFQFSNGWIIADALEIVNVIGKVDHRVGYWTNGAAFTKNIGKMNSSSSYGLEPIVWPGGIQSNIVPPVNGTLSIGIPVQYRTGRLMHVESDAKYTCVSGFCVDVLVAALDALDYAVNYTFIPFLKNAKVGTVNYNDLIDRIHTGEFDIGVGDITITANRSLYVDFTPPFTDLGLATLSRNADAESMWIFMQPLSSDLWVVSTCFFILLGFVIWILEHRTNEEFQGSLLQQIGTTFWFSFSTIVYAHRQKLQSNLSRFVVTVWLFVVLVLVACYTATLSSLLTVEQIQLASLRGSIGYQLGSPVQGAIKNMNFEDTRLKPYSSPEEYALALSLGSKNGGVDAIIDEIPYIKEFLAVVDEISDIEPSGYTMTVSESTTNGFGFAFPLGSPLARDISREIAKLREDGTLKMLEDKWLKPQSKGHAPSPKVLNFEAFRGLFLISGASMAVALFLFMLYYIHEKVHFAYLMLAGGKLAFILNLFIPMGGNKVDEI